MQIRSEINLNPNPIRSNSFGFRNKNVYFGSDRIAKVVSRSDRFGLDAEYQIQSKVNYLFMTKLNISRKQFVIPIIYCVMGFRLVKLRLQA